MLARVNHHAPSGVIRHSTDLRNSSISAYTTFSSAFIP